MTLIERRLEQLIEYGGPVIILDPQSISSRYVKQIFETSVVVSDWFGLRKWWEHVGKNLPENEISIALIKHSNFRTSLDVPPDMLESAKVLELGTDLSDSIAQMLPQLPSELTDRLCRPGANDSLAVRLICDHFGLMQSAPLRPSDQVRNALILRMREDIPEVIRNLILNLATDEIAEEIAAGSNLVSTQAAWNEWLDIGPGTHETTIIDELGPELMPLFPLGLLSPSQAKRQVPDWAKIGISDTEEHDQIEGVLSSLPTSHPNDLETWLDVAGTLGELRWRTAVGSVSADLRNEVLVISDQLSSAFEEWIQRSHSKIITRSSGYPTSVANIADFLRRRLNSTRTQRIGLLVLDGLGMSHWAQIKSQAKLDPIESHALFAVIPTVTSISRQSIFAGKFPKDFGDSIGTTSKEEQLWRKFWVEEGGLSEFEVGYKHTDGSSGPEELGFGQHSVTGIVALAIDTLGHSSTVYHDVQHIQGIEEWLRRGFLKGVIEQAIAHDTELWITSDHGNRYCEGIGPSNPGVLGERASTRVQIFKTESARDASDVPGIRWDPSSTLPDDVFPLFASGSDAYTSRNKKLLTHGGLSIHEVVVPLVRIV